MSAVPIGIAVVESNGRYLVGVRPPGAPLAGCAEFPGGKCEPGESPESCAVRECLEETGLAVTPLRLLDRRAWDYPHGRVDLTFILCAPPVPRAEPLPPWRWVPAAELATLPFPQANAAVLRLLTG